MCGRKEERNKVLGPNFYRLIYLSIAINLFLDEWNFSSRMRISCIIGWSINNEVSWEFILIGRNIIFDWFRRNCDELVNNIVIE